MNLQKADYGTITQFGSLDDLNQKLGMQTQSLGDVLEQTDANGISLLQKALIGRKFDIAKYLLDEGAKINIISKGGCNELHYLAANINFDAAIPVARLLIKHSADLNHVDKKYGNSALLSLGLELLKRHTEEGMKFLEEILSQDIDLDIVNKSGVCVRTLLHERGTDRMKLLLKDKEKQKTALALNEKYRED